MNIASIKDVSAFLKVKESTLYSWAHKGQIPCFKLNGLLRFDLDEIDRWVKDSRLKASASLPSMNKQPLTQIDRLVSQTIASVKNRN